MIPTVRVPSVSHAHWNWIKRFRDSIALLLRKIAIANGQRRRSERRSSYAP